MYVNIVLTLQITNNNPEPFSVSEGGSVNIGLQLTLSDVDADNSNVNISRMLVEVLDGSPAETLFFEDAGGSGFFGGGSGDRLLPIVDAADPSVILLLCV